MTTEFCQLDVFENDFVDFLNGLDNYVKTLSQKTEQLEQENQRLEGVLADSQDRVNRLKDQLKEVSQLVAEKTSPFFPLVTFFNYTMAKSLTIEQTSKRFNPLETNPNDFPVVAFLMEDDSIISFFQSFVVVFRKEEPPTILQPQVQLPPFFADPSTTQPSDPVFFFNESSIAISCDVVLKFAVYESKHIIFWHKLTSVEYAEPAVEVPFKEVAFLS